MYFVEYDEPSGLWCIFHTDRRQGFAYESYLNEKQAEARVKELNNNKL